MQTPITADEARQLADQTETPDISGWIKVTDQKIRNEAAQGRRILPDPFKGVRMTCDLKQRALIKEYYIGKGFRWDEENGLCSINW
jgi:hypothetical protein